MLTYQAEAVDLLLRNELAGTQANIGGGGACVLGVGGFKK